MKIIAELCQNHNGDHNLIEKMIDEAIEGGATHVKLQTIYASNLTFRPEFEEGLNLNGERLCIKRPWKEEYNRLKKLELSQDHFSDFVSTCKRKGVIPLTTCFSIDRIEEIISQGFEEIKVASYDCASYSLIRGLIDNFKHIYVSTGATFNEEIEKTFSLLSNAKKSLFTFLHCITIYPTPLSELHLERINWLKKFSNEVGFSDHTAPKKTGIIASCAAIYWGADVIERHFTILKPEETKDGPVSITKEELSEIKSFSLLSKEEQKMWLDEKFPEWLYLIPGEAKRNLTKEELLNRSYYRGRFSSKRQNCDAFVFAPRFNWEEA